jgi:hypothetical protein
VTHCFQGYLRVARSLETSGKQGLASKQLAIYDRGLRKTSPNDVNFKVLHPLLRLSLPLPSLIGIVVEIRARCLVYEALSSKGS